MNSDAPVVTAESLLKMAEQKLWYKEIVVEALKGLGILMIFILFSWAFIDMRSTLKMHNDRVSLNEQQIEEMKASRISLENLIAMTIKENQKTAERMEWLLKKNQENLDLSIKTFRSRDKVYAEMVIELREIYKLLKKCDDQRFRPPD